MSHNKLCSVSHCVHCSQESELDKKWCSQEERAHTKNPKHPGSRVRRKRRGTAVATKYSYIQPPNFNNRNSELVDCVMAALKDQSALERFRQMSSGFRQNYLTAEDYYNHCQEAMGTSKFSEIFPELLVLLPDIEKQQELWKMYRSSRHSLKPPKLDVCVVCSQVVRNTDLQQHLSAHNLENDFPALANGSAQKIGNTSKDKK